MSIGYQNLVSSAAASSLKEVLTVGGREVRVVGTDAVITSDDFGNYLVCNDEDFTISLNDNIATAGGGCIIISNPKNTNNPSLVINEDLTVVNFKGNQYFKNDVIDIPSGTILELFCTEPNVYDAVFTNVATTQEYEISGYLTQIGNDDPEIIIDTNTTNLAAANITTTFISTESFLINIPGLVDKNKMQWLTPIFLGVASAIGVIASPDFKSFSPDSLGINLFYLNDGSPCNTDNEVYQVFFKIIIKQ